MWPFSSYQGVIDNTASSIGHETIKKFSNYLFVSEAKKSADYSFKEVKHDFFFNEKKSKTKHLFSMTQGYLKATSKISKLIWYSFLFL